MKYVMIFISSFIFVYFLYIIYFRIKYFMYMIRTLKTFLDFYIHIYPRFVSYINNDISLDSNSKRIRKDTLDIYFRLAKKINR